MMNGEDGIFLQVGGDVQVLDKRHGSLKEVPKHENQNPCKISTQNA